MDKKDKIEVRFAPSFFESFYENVPEEDRDDALKALDEVIQMIQNNPYSGTPAWGGILRPLIVFWNWVKRTLWQVGFRKGL